MKNKFIIFQIILNTIIGQEIIGDGLYDAELISFLRENVRFPFEKHILW